MGELVDPVDLKSTAICVPVRLRLLVPIFIRSKDEYYSKKS